MAEKINTMTKYVVSSSAVETSDWQDVTAIGEDVLGRVAALKEGEGGPILIAGSRTLAQSLLTAGLVDQVNLQVFPVILGSGARFYPESPDKLALELVSSREVPNGVLLQSYRSGGRLSHGCTLGRCTGLRRAGQVVKMARVLRDAAAQSGPTAVVVGGDARAGGAVAARRRRSRVGDRRMR